jgi:hypothetical protein
MSLVKVKRKNWQQIYPRRSAMPGKLDGAYLQLHLEPNSPLEIGELTGALNAFAHQYQVFALAQPRGEETLGGRLLVASVAPGSIDVNFIPLLVATAQPLLPMIDPAVTLAKFASSVMGLVAMFAKKDKGDRDPTVRDCDDAINILKPIAQNGGSQTFNVYNNSAIYQSVTISDEMAKEAIEGALRKRAELQIPEQGPRQCVATVWKQLARDAAKTTGRSPDKGLITEIDSKPHPVLFKDDMGYLKREMIDDLESPFKKVFFVDVEVISVADKIAGYRITGYHTSDDIEE